MLTEKETQAVLSTLCVKLGFCDSDDGFFDLKLETVDEFTMAVIRADGLDLDERSNLYKQVREVVLDASEKHLNVEKMAYSASEDVV